MYYAKHRQKINNNSLQKQPPRGALWKRCSENMQQIYRRTSMAKCNFNKLLLNFIEITLRHKCSPVNLLHIFRTPFLKNTSEWLLQSLFRTLLPHPDLCSMMRSKNEFKKPSPGVVL